MATFLTTTHISSTLEDIIKETEEKLILISPYLQFNERIKEYIGGLSEKKVEIQILFKEDKLRKEDILWLSQNSNIEKILCPNLHAKCYLNEKEAIITSMNLYEFSQLNNNEMGIHLTKINDPKLYNAVNKEADRLLTQFKKTNINVKTVTLSTPYNKENTIKQNGYCIRTGVPIPFNVEKPMCYEAFKSWDKFADSSYPEKFCHFSGEKSKGETCVKRPILKQNWKRATETHNSLL